MTEPAHKPPYDKLDTGENVKCYAWHCPLPPTKSLAVRNHVTWKWTSGGLTYCDEHAVQVALTMSHQGLDTRLTILETSQTGPAETYEDRRSEYEEGRHLAEQALRDSQTGRHDG